MWQYNDFYFKVRGAIQTHCAMLNVDSTLEIWITNHPPSNVHPLHKKNCLKIHESNVKTLNH